MGKKLDFSIGSPTGEQQSVKTKTVATASWLINFYSGGAHNLSRYHPKLCVARCSNWRESL